MAQQPSHDPHGLETRDNHGKMHTFNHIDDKIFWLSINPIENRCIPFSKPFASFMDKLNEKFPICHETERVGRREARSRMNILKRLFRIFNETGKDGMVPLTVFIQITKAIGPFREISASDKNCVFLQQLNKLSKNSTENRKSWFAAHMTSSEAEEKLAGNSSGTFLIRFSEGFSDEGAYALSVIAKDETILHFNIMGNLSEGANSHPFHNQLKLIHHASEELNHHEGSYSDIVCFRKERLMGLAVIEGQVVCTSVCPGLPFNGDFNGYK